MSALLSVIDPGSYLGQVTSENKGSKSEAPKQGHAKKFQNYEITPKELIYLKQLKFF